MYTKNEKWILYNQLQRLSYRATFSPDTEHDGDHGDDGGNDPDVSKKKAHLSLSLSLSLSVRDSRGNVSWGPPLIVVKFTVLLWIISWA